MYKKYLYLCILFVSFFVIYDGYFIQKYVTNLFYSLNLKKFFLGIRTIFIWIFTGACHGCLWFSTLNIRIIICTMTNNSNINIKINNIYLMIYIHTKWIWWILLIFVSSIFTKLSQLLRHSGNKLSFKNLSKFSLFSRWLTILFATFIKWPMYPCLFFISLFLKYKNDYFNKIIVLLKT